MTLIELQLLRMNQQKMLEFLCVAQIYFFEVFHPLYLLDGGNIHSTDGTFRREEDRIVQAFFTSVYMICDVVQIVIL